VSLREQMSPSHCISWQRTADWLPADEVSKHACKFNYPFVSMLDDTVRSATADDRRNWGSSLGKRVLFFPLRLNLNHCTKKSTLRTSEIWTRS